MPRRRASAPLLLLPLLLAVQACSGSSEPPTVSAVVLSPPTATLLVGPAGGQQTALTASPQQANGRPVAGRVVTWTSSSPTVASVSAGGIVTAIAPGTATIQATVDAVIGSAVVTVLPVPVATVVITPDAVSLPVGVTRTFTATARDSTGAMLTGRSVTWTSANPAVAAVSGPGQLVGLAVGSTELRATVGERTASIPVTVTPPPGPVVSAVAPAILVPGQAALLTGEGFAAAAADNVVRVGGRQAVVTAASPTLLTFTVPCVATGTVALEVTSPVGTGPAVQVPVSAPGRNLAPGQSLILTGQAESLCNELLQTGPGTRYLLAVSSNATNVNTLFDLEVAGSTATARDPSVRRLALRTDPAPLPVSAAQREDEVHAQHMARQAQLYAALQASGAFRESAGRARAAQVAPPQVGDLRRFFYNYGGCSDSTQTFDARVVFVGPRTIVWEDTLNTVRADAVPAMAEAYQRLGQIHEDDWYNVVKDHFGDPLRRDPLTDNDGRLHMVFTQRLNGTGAAAYVTSCDMSPRNTTNRAASNHGEFFYGTVPTQVGSNLTSSAFPDGWAAFMGRTVVHEVKHIASLSARIANNAPWESGWLEEGTARHAEELWARAALHRTAFRGNAGYGTAAANGVFCDFNLVNATCLANDALRRPSWGVRRQFHELRSKLFSPWAWSPYGDGTGQTGAVFYNTAWSLVRYAIDRYGTSDAAFLTQLTQSTTTGLTNLSAVTGVSADQLLGGWHLALAADDLPGTTGNADVQFATWNFRDIYAGLRADPLWSSNYPTAYPIVPVSADYGAFLASRAGLRAGGAYYLELSGGSAEPQLIELRGPAGAVASPSVRVAILRVQ